MRKSLVANRVILYTFVVLASALVAATWAGPFQSQPTAAPAPKWQFASLKVPADTPENELGRQVLKMGQDGWELVSVENFAEDGTTTMTAFYFKRPL